MFESKASNTTTSIKDRELLVTRAFATPRELVYKAWTDPEHLPHWWGPRGFTVTVLEIDVRPGGVWHYIMHGPDGTDYDNKITYREVVRPERLVYSHGGDGDDEHFHVTVTFEEKDGQTELKMRTLFKSAEELERAANEYGAIEGAKSTLDRLEERLAELAR
ncbi:ATPase [Paenibacillus hemerocallicola]|uniref:ATPase n=1 Tax=Paenibacillus hemerocallicola TaxID=1172614 RepID=A0A5C4T2H6_9BACL|nr:SRPBCC family protein [Paenibacillus hemerocallicola]TNJ62339.1 ATPase [Paenibacillus hemerocallicola]